MMFLLAMGSTAHAAVSYSYADLVGTLTNLEHLAELPLAGEKSAEWTSRDRASTYDATQYLNWNANNDGTGNLGTQADGGIIMAQMNGPGCIWRMWSAQVGTGHVKIFLDGSNSQAVDLAFQDYFNRSHFPFNYPSLTYSVCGGFDSYVPIPYNVSCKVVGYGSWGQYFHFNYSTFAPGVTVPTFTTNLTAAEQMALSNVNDFFVNHLGSDPASGRSGEITITNSYAIPPGKTVTNLNLSGQGAITTLKVRVQNIAGTNASWQALRELTLSMYWDGEATPSVWAPLGDFFGSGCGYIPYRALSLGMETNGWMYSHWYMPYASAAQMVLGNDGSVTRNVEVIVTSAPLSKPIANLARFHAKWNRGTYVTNNGRSPDYRFLNASGQGRFVGLAMHVYQKVDFSPGPWWGEGDEKFFVDGETMPSWFGTGSEDYFGFAWGTPGYFSQPYHSQLLAPPGNLFAPGNRALNRFHITDNVPFQTGFDGCIEKWQYTNDNVTTYGVMPYWYLASGATDSYGPQSLNVRTNYYVSDSPQFSSPGLLAYEGFNYQSGRVISGQSGGVGWSNVWMDVSGNSGGAVNSANLLASNNAPNGFDNLSSGNSAFVGSNSRIGRWLDCSVNGTFAQAGYVNASGNVGVPGKTLYVSFLQQANSPAQFYELEFHRGNLGDPGRIAGIGNDLPNATTVNLRAPNSVQTPFAMGDTRVNFYVVRIDYHGGSDDVYIYRNPTGVNESDNSPALTMPGVADMSFDGISMAAYLNGVTVNHDEIRLGTSWASVLGGPLTFVVQPTNQVAFVGQTVTMTSLAQFSEPLNYQWYHGNILLAGQTNETLTLSDVQLADTGDYSVTASNALASATSAVMKLTVRTVSVAVSGPASVPIGPGSNVLISATVGGASPLILQWYKNGGAIPGATASTLALGSNGFFDAGKYSLVASNIYGTVTSSVVNVFSNSGGLLAYDGFNYGQSSSDIAGANGGFGWAGAWASLNGAPSQSLSNSLVGGANAPFEYDSHSLDGYLTIANSSRKGRFFDCSPAGAFAERGYVDSNGNIGADGTTLYISFLQRPSSTSPFYEFELKRGDLGDGGRIGGIGNDIGSGNNDANLRIQSPAGGNSTFYDLGPGSTGVNFYVLRIDYRAGNDSVTVYRNPVSATEPATPTLTVSNVADLSLNGISFGAYLNSLTVSHDEVRVGATWADVVGNAASELQVAPGTNNALSLSLAGSPNYSYQVQASTNVAGPWTNVGSVALPSSGASQWIETNAINDHRFYRVLNGLAAHGPQSSDVIIADFEQPTYGTWVMTGTAFGSGPAQGTLSNQQTVSGYTGSGLVNSYLGTDTSTGTLTSPPFIITKPYLDFLIGGGNLPGQECMNLNVSNVVVATATGADSETLTPMQWDVSAYLGQTATLQIVDSATGGWGHILIDQITLSATAFPALSRTMLLTNNLLNLPVKNGATMKRVTITTGGKVVRDFNIQLANGIPDWWAFVDVSAFSNQMATVSVNSLPPGSTGLSSVVQSNGIVDATNLYAETLRPQLHFSSKRGWLNDANGMFYDNGRYHLYYQHDPFNWDGSGQKWWGHAVSADMVNWQELPEGIYSHAYGDDVWSGSSVVDAANTSGLQAGTNSVIATAFYSTARGECMTFSTDGGQTFVDFTNNPVVVHSGTGRDPHLFWYAPSNYWCMAVYDDAGGNGVQFYSSPDLRHWTFRSKIYNGFFECPDMFQLPVDGSAGNRMWVLCDASGAYQLGQFNGATFTPATAKFPCQFGSGFYASQTFTSMKPADNRVVRMAWAQISTPGMPFNQLMYFPTALTLQTTSNGVRLCSTPVAEITNNAVNVYSWTNLTLNPGYNALSGIRGALFDVKAQFSVGTAQAIMFTFQGTTVTYNAASQQISCNGDTQSLPALNGSVQLEIVVDRNTIEIFGNNGQLYMPLPANNSSGNSLISLTCTGGIANFSSLTVNQLKSIWTGLSSQMNR